jgi:hypothetical protein
MSVPPPPPFEAVGTPPPLYPATFIAPTPPTNTLRVSPGVTEIVDVIDPP